MLLEDLAQDMAKEAIDVGLHVGVLPHSIGTARLIGKMQRVIVASPAYLARYGTPAVPSDLAQHRIVRGPISWKESAWHFKRDGEVVTVPVSHHVSLNDTAGTLAAAIGNLGVTSTTSWACHRELESGSLVQVLHEWEMTEIPVHAYIPLGRSSRLAARTFLDFLAAELVRDWQDLHSNLAQPKRGG